MSHESPHSSAFATKPNKAEDDYATHPQEFLGCQEEMKYNLPELIEDLFDVFVNGQPSPEKRTTIEDPIHFSGISSDQKIPLSHATNAAFECFLSSEEDNDEDLPDVSRKSRLQLPDHNSKHFYEDYNSRSTTFGFDFTPMKKTNQQIGRLSSQSTEQKGNPPSRIMFCPPTPHNTIDADNPEGQEYAKTISKKLHFNVGEEESH